MLNESQTRSAERIYARTNRELFRPRETTGNPHYDFYTHYSRLSGLERLSLETHTVNGTQISRYEPDISHSTTCVNAPGFIASVEQRARVPVGRGISSRPQHQLSISRFIALYARYASVVLVPSRSGKPDRLKK